PCADARALDRRKPAAVHQVRAALGRAPQGGDRRGPVAHRTALGRRAVAGLLRRARAAGAALPARPAHRRPGRNGAGNPRRGRPRAARLDARLRRHELDSRRRARGHRGGLEPDGYVVATIHREANVRPERLARIVEGLNRIEEAVVFPAHPRTRGRLAGLGPHVQVLEALSYVDMLALASQARVIVTDSGGLQKEAYWFGVPCVTARPSTEWVDTVEVGANVLVDDDPERLAAAVAEARMPKERPELYGHGRPSEPVAAALLGSLPGS